MPAKKATTPDNLTLWNSLFNTDPQYTKSFNRAGFKGTAVKPGYIIQKLTEAFGPCGKGWKFVVEEDQYVPGHRLSSGDPSIVHVIRGHLEYTLDGATYTTGPQYGQTDFVGENKNGTFTDSEAPKKSITDAMAKCAALLGVSGDVYLGSFDGNKYVVPQSAPPAAPITPPAPVMSTAPASTQCVGPGPQELPSGCAYWLPEQYSSFIDTIDSPGILIATTEVVLDNQGCVADSQALQGLCQQISAKARTLCAQGTMDWDKIVSLMQKAKGLIQ